MKAVNYHRATSNYEQLFVSDVINKCRLATAPEEGPFSSSRNVYSFCNAGMETPFKWQVFVNILNCRQKHSYLTEEEKLRKILTVHFYFSFSCAWSGPNKSSVTEKCWHIMRKILH